MISLEGVSKTYPARGGPAIEALRKTDLEIARGDFLVITGRSGSGKTTLLNVAAGLARPYEGTVRIDGVDLWSLSDRERSQARGRAMGFVFQFPSLLPALSVLDNVALPLAFGGRQRAQDPGRARELLELVGLGGRVRALPRQLSAGQQQRAVIARALIGEPQILLADEPSSDLDEDTEAEIMALFGAVHAERGITVLLVTHARHLVTHGTRHVEMVAGTLQPGAD